MAKQYGQHRRQDDRLGQKSSAEKRAAIAVPIRRYNDKVHSGQLMWSFAVAFCLVLAALFQWSSPKNALLEQDRSPAAIRLDLSSGGS